MFDWTLVNFLWLFVAGFCVGFGWTLAVAIIEELRRDRNP